MILTTFSRVIQCEKFIKDESASLAVYASLYDLNMCILKTKGSTKEPVLRQIRKTTKKPPFRSGQKICGNVFLI